MCSIPSNCFVEFKIYISLKLKNSQVSKLEFCRIQNLHISQTKHIIEWLLTMFCRIQNLHISQTYSWLLWFWIWFCRIQNLHISQTIKLVRSGVVSFVEFKIYISLKHSHGSLVECSGFVEFKIYISLKPRTGSIYRKNGFVEFKIYISLKHNLN